MLRDELTADPLGIGYATMTNAEVEDALNAKTRTKTIPTEVGNGAILEVLGMTAGNALLDVINTVPDFRHVKPLVEQGRLRLDSALVRATLDSLVPAVLTKAQADTLKAKAEVACSRAEELGVSAQAADIMHART